MINKVLAVIGAVIMISACVNAEQVDVSSIMKDGAIRVYVQSVTNESGEKQLNADEFKKIFEAAFANRQSMKFIVVKNPAESNIQVSVIMQKYQYMENDPIKPSISPETLLLDAATTENYVEMDSKFTVTDTKTGKVIWNDSVYDYIKHTMTPAQSIPMIYEKLSRVFLWKCFGKGKTFHPGDSASGLN